MPARPWGSWSTRWREGGAPPLRKLFGASTHHARPCAGHLRMSVTAGAGPPWAAALLNLQRDVDRRAALALGAGAARPDDERVGASPLQTHIWETVEAVIGKSRYSARCLPSGKSDH